MAAASLAVMYNGSDSWSGSTALVVLPDVCSSRARAIRFPKTSPPWPASQISPILRRAAGRCGAKCPFRIGVLSKQVRLSLWLDGRTRVRFRVPPPLTEIPTLSGWDFFCPFPQCWRGSARLPLERQACAGDRPAALTARFLSLFSVRLLTAQGQISALFKGLRATG